MSLIMSENNIAKLSKQCDATCVTRVEKRVYRYSNIGIKLKRLFHLSPEPIKSNYLIQALALVMVMSFFRDGSYFLSFSFSPTS